MKNYRKSFVLLLILCGLFQVPVSAQQKDELQAKSAKIAGSVLVGGHSMEYLRELTDQFGQRLTGTSGHRKAAEWAAEQFRAAGITNVKLETFTIPNGWERGAARGRFVAPVERPLHFESLGWTPPTPAGGVKAEVTVVRDISPEALNAQADKLKNQIVLIDFASAMGGAGKKGLKYLRASYPIFKDAGAQAVLLPDRENNNVLNTSVGGWDCHTAPLPVVRVGMEDSKLIFRLLEKGPVTLELNIENRVTGPTEAINVIAELPGREKTDEWLLVGAHLDAWDFGTGAQDNGSGCATVLETARVLASLGQPPRRTIRFALWSGEEQGLLGSFAYVKAHSAELDHCVMVLNNDNGPGHPQGWKVEGRDDLKNALKPISSLLTGLDGGGISSEFTFDTDHGPFALEGVPTLDQWVDFTHYMEVHHKASDTLDKVDAHNLALGTAIMAVTTYAIAEKPERLVPRLNHDAVEEILKKEDMLTILKDFGRWK